MSFNNYMYSQNTNLFSFYFLYILFLLNQYVVHSKKIKELIWKNIKLDIFYLAGNCGQTGNCCHEIMLYIKDKPIQEFKEFEKQLKSNKTYQRFYPILKQDNASIKYFNCYSLTEKNECRDYQNRPQICRNYPASYFLKHNRVFQGCNYKIKIKENLPKITNPYLESLISTIVLYANPTDKIQ